MRTQTLIEYGVYDVTAKEDSMPSVTDKQDFVNILDLKKDDIKEIKYSTLEKNYFVLDGNSFDCTTRMELKRVKNT